MKVLGITGHRPKKLGGYDKNSAFNECIILAMENFILGYNPDKLISGMAIGIDQWAAEIAIENKIPLIAAVPFKGQEKMWPENSQGIYNSVLVKAAEVVIVSEGIYSLQKMQIRNEWIVDHSDQILAVWDGSGGGTYNCIQYAKLKKIPTHRINPYHLGEQKWK